MYENKTEKCPVAFFLLLKSKRLVELRNMGPSYLTVIDAPLTDVSYVNHAMGGQHNKHNVEQNEKKSPIAELCANKKITNYSARKTTVRKFKSFGFPKCDIKKHHRSQL